MDPMAIIAGSTPAAPATATPPKAEGATPPPAAESEKHSPVSPQLGILARKEKAIVQKERELKQREKEWEDFKQRMAGYEAKEKLWKENPRKALEEYGHSYQSLTEQVLNDGDLTPEKVDEMLEKKLSARQKAEQEAKEKAEQEEAERLKGEEEKAVTEYKGKLQEFIKEKAEEFPLVNLLGADADLMYDVMDEYYQKGNPAKGVPPGKVLTNAEAAEMVEKYFRGLVEKANEALKPKPPKAEGGKEGEGEKLPEGASLSTTLTNNMTGTLPSALPAKSEADRMARALAALDGKK